MRTKTYFSAMLGFRHFSSSEHTAYRFGFNGQEKDDEIANVSGGHVSFEYRTHDTRLGRFISRDPYQRYIHNKSTYSFAGNSPIAFIDYNGGYQMTPDDINDYPVLAGLNRMLSDWVNSTSIDDPFFKEWSNALCLSGTEEEKLEMMKSILTFGTGPLIVIDSEASMDGAAGYVDVGPSIDKGALPYANFSEEVHINQKLVNSIEFGKRSGNVKSMAELIAWTVAAYLTLWHESGHYADLMDDGRSDAFDYSKGEVLPSPDMMDDAEKRLGYPGYVPGKTSVETIHKMLIIDESHIYRPPLIPFDTKSFYFNDIRTLFKSKGIQPGATPGRPKSGTKNGGGGTNGGSQGSHRNVRHL